MTRGRFVFAWWDHAVTFALCEALVAGVRQRVQHNDEGLWEVVEAQPPAPKLQLVTTP